MKTEPTMFKKCRLVARCTLHAMHRQNNMRCLVVYSVASSVLQGFLLSAFQSRAVSLAFMDEDALSS
jgi:hypothetical protein